MRIIALAAVGGLAPALLLTACNSDKGGLRTPPPAASAAAGATTGGAATGTAGAGKAPAGGDAAKVAAGITLGPAEWGKGYTEDDPYEDPSLDYYVTDANCKGVLGKAPASLAGAMTRLVKVPAAGKADLVDHLGSTSALVFGDVADAQKDFTTSRGVVKRCPTWTSDDGSETDTDEHEVPAPALPLADEAYAQEGKVRYADDKTGAKLPYYQLTVRKGGVTLNAYLDGTEDASLADLRAQTTAAMTAMLTKLKAQGH